MTASRGTITGLVLIIAVLAAPVPLAAQESTVPPTPTSLTVTSFIPSDPELSIQLVATLSADGAPVAGATVAFYLERELLGPRFASIGSAVTDVSGSARVAFTPRRNEEPIRVVFAGDADRAGVTADTAVAFPPEWVAAVSMPHHGRGLLSPIRETMPGLIMGAVAILWVFLLGLAASTVRRIRRHGRAPALEEIVDPLNA